METGPVPAAPSIAFLIPCRDEEASIAAVIADARQRFPTAAVHVYDNASSDGSAAVARANGAQVVRVSRAGKGFVVRAMLEQASEDVLVMVDGDDTYGLDRLPEMVEMVRSGECDMVVGARLSRHEAGAFRRLHVLGNELVRWLINHLFASELRDIMSGFRVFSRRAAKTIPVVSKGFEVETELTIQLLTQGYEVREVDVPYRPRRQGSHSKLHTFRDGTRVLWTIFRLFKDVKPLTFFGTLALGSFLASLACGVVVLEDYLVDLYVDRVPLAILATGLFLNGMLCVVLGVVMNSAAEKHNQLMSVLKKLAP